MGRLKSTTRFRPLRDVMCSGDRALMVQFIRLVVLYEDLRIEVAGQQSGNQLPSLEEIDQVYRKMYFVRRSIVTLLEIEAAIHRLSLEREFKEMRVRFTPKQEATWKSATAFFLKHHKFLHSQRSLYGGHFDNKAAEHVYDFLHPQHVGALEITLNHDLRTARPVLKFATELVAVGMTASRGKRKTQPFVRRTMKIITGAMAHATGVARVIQDTQIFPKFGL